METIKDRLVQFLKDQHIPRSQVERKLGWSNGYIAKQSYNPSETRINQLLNEFPRLNPQWLLYGEGEMLRPYVDHSDYAPCIPEYAAAGTLNGMSEGVMPEDCNYLNKVRNIPPYDFTIKVRGDSMAPEIENGDELACRFVTDPRSLQWGCVYVLDTAEGIVVKRVYDAGDNLRCVSTNPKYAEFLVPKDSIQTIAKVTGLVRIVT